MGDDVSTLAEGDDVTDRVITLAHEDETLRRDARPHGPGADDEGSIAETAAGENTRAQGGGGHHEEEDGRQDLLHGVCSFRAGCRDGVGISRLDGAADGTQRPGVHVPTTGRHVVTACRGQGC